MKLVRWTRFTWDLGKLPPLANALDKRYTLRAASREEEPIVHRVIASAFSLDSDWGDNYSTFRDRLQMQLRLSFERESVPALVILHGQRIICASGLTTEVEADSHLLSGPCVLIEYRNRGFGTALLHASLTHLAQSGISLGYGVSKESAPASKFIYPKFGSTRAPCAFETAIPAE